MWNNVIDDWKSDDQKKKNRRLIVRFLCRTREIAFTVVV